jgi:prophage regulatory protein
MASSRTQKAGINKRMIRRHELRAIVPLADSTIYEMEQRGEFPRRFLLTPRCVVWDLLEIEAWIEERRKTSVARAESAPHPDVRLRKSRPVVTPQTA